MGLLFGVLCLICSFIGALYLQLPTFILFLGYGWSHNYPLKRWIMRIFALGFFLIFISLSPSLWMLYLFGIPFIFFWIFSLFNANTNLFVVLNEQQIIKQKEQIYTAETGVVGYVGKSNNAICYPVNEMIIPRHLLNDIFIGQPILVSYCAACKSTMVYNPVVDNQRLSFEVVGVRRRNMIIRDIQTGTIWQQGTGEAVYGKLKGQKLDHYHYQQISLKNWINEYPNTFIAKEGNNIKRSLVPKSRLVKILKVTEKFIAPGKTDLTGLPLREIIWGLELNDMSIAYPLSELKKITEVYDSLGGIDIHIEYNPDTNRIYGKNIVTNEILKFQQHAWFGWKEFHPETKIWQK